MSDERPNWFYRFKDCPVEGPPYPGMVVLDECAEVTEEQLEWLIKKTSTSTPCPTINLPPRRGAR